MPRGDVMRHMLAGKNLGLSQQYAKLLKAYFNHVFAIPIYSGK